MASISSPLNSASDPSSASGSAASNSADSSTAALGNESTFLQLLVTEIQNQDPTQPMDSTTFLTQLAQFSQLEQVVGIRQDIESGTYAPPTTPASTDNTTTPASAATDPTAANSTAATTAASLANDANQAISNTVVTPPTLPAGI